jgi:hypothetical protein
VNFQLFDRLADSDGDGILDSIEAYVMGTNPYDSNDYLRCLSANSLSSSTATITWASVAGHVYDILRCTNLNENQGWHTNGTVTATSTNSSHLDTNAWNMGFYRIHCRD